MTTHIARNDATAISQVTTLTPTVVNAGVYGVKLNTKNPGSYTSDGSATAQEIVEELLAVLTASTIPEVAEVTWTENDAIITGTGKTTGEPFTVVDNSSASGALTVATTTTPVSPNDWAAANFNSGSLPANGDTVVITNLSSTQGFKYKLDQNAVTLASLQIKADSQASIGLPEMNTSTGTPYYQAAYRNTHLKISATSLKIGEGIGPGAGLIKIHTGTNACSAIVFQTTSNKASQNEAPVHLAGSHADNTFKMFNGEVDIAMLPGYTGQWPVINCSGGTLRCGASVTLGLVEAAGTANVETRSSVTTYRTRENGRAKHIGAGDITTLDHAGGSFEIQATSAITITTLNAYDGQELDLSSCDHDVTVTNMNVYATPSSPFTINDPANKLVMTNPASTPNGAQSLKVVTGSGRTVKVA